MASLLPAASVYVQQRDCAKHSVIAIQNAIDTSFVKGTKLGISSLYENKTFCKALGKCPLKTRRGRPR